MKIRDFTPDDLPMVRSWYARHFIDTEGPADCFLKRGWIVESNFDIPLIALFYYLDVEGHFASVDWLVRNPDYSDMAPVVLPFFIEHALPQLKAKLGHPHIIQMNVSKQSHNAIPIISKYGFEYSSGEDAVLMVASEGLFKRKEKQI